MPAFKLTTSELDSMVAALEAPVPEGESAREGSVWAVGVGAGVPGTAGGGAGGADRAVMAAIAATLRSLLVVFIFLPIVF